MSLTMDTHLTCPICGKPIPHTVGKPGKYSFCHDYFSDRKGKAAQCPWYSRGPNGKTICSHRDSKIDQDFRDVCPLACQCRHKSNTDLIREMATRITELREEFESRMIDLECRLMEKELDKPEPYPYGSSIKIDPDLIFGKQLKI